MLKFCVTTVACCAALSRCAFACFFLKLWLFSSEDDCITLTVALGIHKSSPFLLRKTLIFPGPPFPQTPRHYVLQVFVRGNINFQKQDVFKVLDLVCDTSNTLDKKSIEIWKPWSIKEMAVVTCLKYYQLDNQHQFQSIQVVIYDVGTELFLCLFQLSRAGSVFTVVVHL